MKRKKEKKLTFSPPHPVDGTGNTILFEDSVTIYYGFIATSSGYDTTTGLIIPGKVEWAWALPSWKRVPEQTVALQNPYQLEQFTLIKGFEKWEPATIYGMVAIANIVKGVLHVVNLLSSIFLPEVPLPDLTQLVTIIMSSQSTQDLFKNTVEYLKQAVDVKETFKIIADNSPALYKTIIIWIKDNADEICKEGISSQQVENASQSTSKLLKVVGKVLKSIGQALSIATYGRDLIIYFADLFKCEAPVYWFVEQNSNGNFVICVRDRAPALPQLSGPTSGNTGESLTFSAVTTDPDGDEISYRFSWGDGDTSGWSNFVSSGQSISMEHTYENAGTYTVMVQAKDTKGARYTWNWKTALTVTIGEVQNNPPDAPVISGSDSAQVNESVTFTASATDPDGDNVAIRFDWGDGDTSSWSSYVSSGQSISMSHTYTSTGTYYVKAQAKDENGALSGWSTAHEIVIYETGVDTTGLVLYLSFDEGQGDTAYDYSGHGNHGVIYGATWTQGISGNALYFDGVDDYVKVANEGFTSFEISNQEYSIALWVNLKSLPSSGDYTFCIDREETNCPISWCIGYRATDPVTGENYAFRVAAWDGWTENWLFSSIHPDTGTWYFLVAVFNTSNISLFINGIFDTSTAIVISGTRNTEGINIGRCPVNGNYLHGIIDEVRIYNRALSDEEIKALYESYLKNLTHKNNK